ncbi:MAG: hypothetical protein FWG87_07435 [Defluviitaleaceae bacterium]|nr:hypothetical protein [Defluviitaleaceae bacterium]
MNTDLRGLRGFCPRKFTERRYIFPRANPLNPRKSVKSVFLYLNLH